MLKPMKFLFPQSPDAEQWNKNGTLLHSESKHKSLTYVIISSEICLTSLKLYLYTFTKKCLKQVFGTLNMLP